MIPNFLTIFNSINQTHLVDSFLNIKRQKSKLQKKYKKLIEEAYNFRQTDHALSDISEYRALKLLDKLNKLTYLERDSSHPLSLN